MYDNLITAGHPSPVANESVMGKFRYEIHEFDPRCGGVEGGVFLDFPQQILFGRRVGCFGVILLVLGCKESLSRHRHHIGRDARFSIKGCVTPAPLL